MTATAAVKIEGFVIGKTASNGHGGRESFGTGGNKLRRESQIETDGILPVIKREQGHTTFRALFSLDL